jgi:hypothetical protein
MATAMATIAIKRFPEGVLLAVFPAVNPKMPIESSKRATAASRLFENAQHSCEEGD